MIEKIISGGQTGVDRAALDAAMANGIACGGWCPSGRHADDGPIPDRYPLQETADMDHTVRTENNVRDSDGTIVMYRGLLQGGTAYAALMAEHLKRPVLALNLDEAPDPESIAEWLEQHRIRVLHIGGQREAGNPGIYKAARQLVGEIIEACRQRSNLP